MLFWATNKKGKCYTTWGMWPGRFPCKLADVSEDSRETHERGFHNREPDRVMKPIQEEQQQVYVFV